MAIELKTAAQIEGIRQASLAVAAVLDRLGEASVPGTSTWDLDQVALAECRRLGVQPAFLGLYGFPASLCVSVNDEVVHGIPSRERRLQDGDIVSCDFGVKQDDWFGDAARTFCVGTVDPRVRRLVDVTEEALYLAIEQCWPGRRLGDLGHAVQQHVERNGFSVVRDFVGHGIGRKPHEDPQVKNYGLPGRGRRLEEGMVLAIEPMVNLGGFEVQVLEDDWTVVTLDRKASAHFEHTVAVTGQGPDILSLASPRGSAPRHA